MVSLAIVPMFVAGAVLLCMAYEDYKHQSIKTTRSYIYESILVACILANFILNWETVAILAVVGIAFYLIAIPALSKFFAQKYNYVYSGLDKEVFIATLVGFPFISIIAFGCNELAFMVKGAIRKINSKFSQQSTPALTVYGGAWFLIACFTIAVYVR